MTSSIELGIIIPADHAAKLEVPDVNTSLEDSCDDSSRLTWCERWFGEEEHVEDVSKSMFLVINSCYVCCITFICTFHLLYAEHEDLCDHMYMLLGITPGFLVTVFFVYLVQGVMVTSTSLYLCIFYNYKVLMSLYM